MKKNPKPSAQQQEFDRTRITISFGLMSFFLAILFFTPKLDQSTFTVFGTLNFVAKAMFGIALLQFFLFIVCIAAHYKTSKKGLLDGAVISPKAGDWYFDQAVEWSFVGISVALSGAAMNAWMSAASKAIERCGEHWMLQATCMSGAISGMAIIVFFSICFFRKQFSF